VPRQKSALLPIVGKGVEGTRVSIYNEGTQPKFPLLGLRLKNTSGLHLMQGPVTVFEGSTYAGDAVPARSAATVGCSSWPRVRVLG
jgi:hypothetical protein